MTLINPTNPYSFRLYWRIVFYRS